jgi:hypothetical protein
MSVSSHNRFFLWEGFSAYAVWLFPSLSNFGKASMFLLDSQIEEEFEQMRDGYDQVSELQSLRDRAELTFHDESVYPHHSSVLS